MNQDKRYQVFISSTFTDLVEERQCVLKSVLELGHMPAGMELFPAVDDDAWRLIRDIIDASDYYVVIVGGRYGSLDEAGLGFTEKEYNYAHSKGKPVIALLHGNPEAIARAKTETQEGAWQKLDAFRQKIATRHTFQRWSSAEELKSKVIIGLTSATKRTPGIGWIRADQIPSNATLADLLELRQKVSELQSELERSRVQAPTGTEELQQGEDPYRIDLEITTRDKSNWSDKKRYECTIFPSWNFIFAAVAPTMIAEASDHQLRASLSEFFKATARDRFLSDYEADGRDILVPAPPSTVIETCIVQMRALGLIRESDRRRSIKDVSTYWSLTPFGDLQMTQLRALRRNAQLLAGQESRIELIQDKANTAEL